MSSASPPRRKLIRLKDYDYSQNGVYFVTICTQGRRCLFGEIVDGEMRVNEVGNLVLATWKDLPNHNAGIELDAFVVMPNHIHGIIMIVGAGSKPARIPVLGKESIACPGIRAGLEPAPTVSLSEIVRQLKTFSARRINRLRNMPQQPVWQRNYYEHIIRNEDDLQSIREYILYNPLQWEEDKLYVKS